MKTKMHFTEACLLNPTHPVTVNLIGCGGTGSQVLTALSRISFSLTALGHPGFHVTVYDPDTVTQANLGRQLFSVSDVGIHKAVILTSRINRFFSIAWQAVPDIYRGEPANIIITCVDNVRSRIQVAEKWLAARGIPEKCDYETPLYWLDFGNTQQAGQVVLGTFGEIRQPASEKYSPAGKLPCITERFDLSTVDEKASGPSCSLAEAIRQQDLFINSTLANTGSHLLWKLFREGMTAHAGVFLNMYTMKMNPILL